MLAISPDLLITVPPVLPPCDVIIVEDEPIARRALCTLLVAHGFVTKAFASAEDALQVVASDGAPAIVLVDFNLPGMNGIEFIRRVEQTDAGVFPVLITGAANDVLDDVRRGHPVACFRKPLDLGCLLRLIANRSAGTARFGAKWCGLPNPSCGG